jgi:hypothetical protein
MKTRTNINNLTVRNFAVVFFLSMASTGLFAQKSLNEDFRNFTANIFRSTEEIAASVLKIDEMPLVEQELKFGDWMIELDAWGRTIDTASAGSAKETDSFEQEELNFEDWMLKTNWLEPANSEKTDPEMELESWMMNPCSWKS